MEYKFDDKIFTAIEASLTPHAVIISNHTGFWFIEELFKRFNVSLKKNKAEDSRSFKDMFLEAHGMKPQKEERIEEMRLRQKPVDQEEFKTHFALSQLGRMEVRTKALELACNLARTPRYDGDIPIVEVAQRFYTYITKEE